MGDERQAREDFNRREKQDSASLAYQAAYRRLEEEHARAFAPFAADGLSGNYVGLLQLVGLVAVVVCVIGIIGYVQWTVLAIAIFLLIAGAVSAAMLPLVVRLRRPEHRGSVGRLFLRCLVANSVATIFFGVIFSLARGIGSRPLSSDKLTALGPTPQFVLDIVFAAARIVQIPGELLGHPMQVGISAYSPSAAGYSIAAAIMIGLPILGYAAVLKRPIGFRRVLPTAILTQAILFATTICMLWLPQGFYALRIFA